VKGIPPFLERSCKISADFLQTAVIIDDQAYPADESENVIPEHIELLEHELAELIDEEAPSPSTVTTALEGNNPIDTKGLVRAFAERGIVCAVIDPPKDPGKFQLAAACRSADIAIVDWYLHDLSGEYAKTLIRHLIQDAEAKYPYQFRLILIYTTEQNLEEIRDKIATMLKGFGRGVTPLRLEGTALRWGSWRFVVLAKLGTDVGSHLASYEVSYADLPDRAIHEFARAVCGILPNVALSGLSAVRRNTFRLLQRLSRKLDPAFLTHRALLPKPIDSEGHVVSLIASELSAILEDEKVGSAASLEAIRDWVEQKGFSYPLDVTCSQGCLPIPDRETLANLLERGLEQHLKAKQPSLSEDKREALEKRVRKRLTKLLGGGPPNEDERYAELTVLRPHYGGVAPFLTLGSILHDKKGKRHWLCIQPRCDCVRLKDARRFLFLPLKEGGQFDFCKVSADMVPLRLLRNRKPYSITTYTFKPDKTGVVRAHRVADHYVFLTSSGKKLRWIGQLRDSIAQDVAQKVGSRLSRVGVDRSEWLRQVLPRDLRDT